MIGASGAQITRAPGHRPETRLFMQLHAHQKLARPPLHAPSRTASACIVVVDTRMRSAAVDTVESSAATPAATPAAAPAESLTWMTCKRCKERFAAERNHRTACRYHTETWTGGELAKATGFVRQSDAPEHQLGVVMGRTGLLRFWDCCGAEDEAAPGCRQSFHCSFDDDVNEKHGWR